METASRDGQARPIQASIAARRSSTSAGVPTIVLHGAADGVSPPEDSAGHARFFGGPYDRRVVPVAGHFLPQEAPDAVLAALADLDAGRN